MTVSQSETPAAAPQAGADISSTKSSVAEEELQSLVSTLAERISLLESQKNDNNNNDVDPNNRATRRANPNRLLWQKRDAAANGSPAIKLVEGIPENNTDDIEEAMNEPIDKIGSWIFRHEQIKTDNDCNWLWKSPETSEYDILSMSDEFWQS